MKNITYTFFFAIFLLGLYHFPIAIAIVLLLFWGCTAILLQMGFRNRYPYDFLHLIAPITKIFYHYGSEWEETHGAGSSNPSIKLSYKEKKVTIHLHAPLLIGISFVIIAFEDTKYKVKCKKIDDFVVSLPQLIEKHTGALEQKNLDDEERRKKWCKAQFNIR